MNANLERAARELYWDRGERCACGAIITRADCLRFKCSHCGAFILRGLAPEITPERASAMLAEFKAARVELGLGDLRRWRVLYRRGALRGPFEEWPAPTVAELQDSARYALITEIVAKTPGVVYDTMQTERWITRGLAEREISARIAAAGDCHSSMSAGDVALDVEAGEYHECLPFGWRIITGGNQ